MLDLTIDLEGLFSSECFMQIWRLVQRQQPFFLRVCSSQGKFVAEIWSHWNFITSLSLDAKLGAPGLPELPMMGSSFRHCGYRSSGLFLRNYVERCWDIDLCIV